MKSTKQRGRWRVFALSLVAALVLAACGGGEEPAEPEPSEPEPSEPSEPAEEPAEEEMATGFYDGKTITFLASVSPGGSVDRTMRLWGQYLPEFLEGDVTIAYENMPGGGHQVGQNHYALNVERNGETILMASGTPHSAWQYQIEGVEFDFRDYEPIAASPGSSIWYAHAENSGIESWEDLASGDHEPLFFPGQTPSGSDLARIWPWHVLDIDINPIWGFEGRGPSRVAFEQGEGNIGTDTSVDEVVAEFINSGLATPLWTTGSLKADGTLERDTVWPDVPTWVEIYEEREGELPSGEMWDAWTALIGVQQELGRMAYMHSEDPPEAVAEIKAAFAAMAEDPEFQAEWEETQGAYPMAIGDDLKALWQNFLADVPQETIDFILEFVMEEYDVDLKTAEG